jgi:hypothetical protein
MRLGQEIEDYDVDELPEGGSLALLPGASNLHSTLGDLLNFVFLFSNAMQCNGKNPANKKFAISLDYSFLLPAWQQLPPGARYRGGRVVVVPEEVEGDLLLPRDHQTARVVQDIANAVCEHTSFKVDFPSAHSSGWMPLLDIHVRVEEDNSMSCVLWANISCHPVYWFKSWFSSTYKCW